MKKLILPILVIFLSACSLNQVSTPKQKVISFLDKYKTEHTNVMEQLEEIIDTSFNKDDYKTRYKELMTNQYKNLSYKITDEKIEDNTAVVEAEVKVVDYGSAIADADRYLQENPDEFKKDDKVDEDKFQDYKLKQMEKVSDTTKYKIEFTLTKNNDNEWEIDPLSDTDLEKLHGIYYE